MSINFKAFVPGLDGEPMKDEIGMRNNGGKDILLTLGAAASHALCIPLQGDESKGWDEKYRMGKLAYEIRDAADMELKSKDVELIKERLSKVYSPHVIFVVASMLDPAEKS